MAGDEIIISWQSVYPISGVCIELYKGKEYYETITTECLNFDSYEWVIPVDILSAEDFQIKVIDLNDADNYCFSGFFRIVGKSDEKNTTYPITEYRQGWEITTVDNNADVGYFTGIDVDNLNRPHISYYDNSTGDLKYCYWDGSAWVIQAVDVGGNVGRWTSLAVNRTNNNVHISYCDEGNRDLKYAKWDGTSWSIAAVDAAGNRGEFTDITLDSNGNPHISYIYGGSGDLMYAFKTGVIWGTYCVDDANDTGRYTSIDLDNNDYPHFSYHDYTWYRYWCKYAYYNGSGWPKQWVDQRGGTGYYTSIVVDNNNIPYISYQGASHCDYAIWTGSNWQLTAVDPYSGELYIGGTCIRIDPLGRPHIAYYRASSTSQGRLAYAHWNGAEWIVEIPDSNGSVGGFPSMVFDSNNCVHISYIDWSNTALKYAKKDLTGIIEEAQRDNNNKKSISVSPNVTSGDQIKISYEISSPCYAQLNVYNSLGTKVRVLSNQHQSLGRHIITWNRHDDCGNKVPPGVYFINLLTNGNNTSAKIIILN